MSLSVFSVIPHNPKEREDTIIEGVRSALRFADEVICFHHQPADGTLEELQALGDERIKIVDGGPWQLDRFCLGRSKNAALQHCTKDWCLLMDADEVFRVKSTNGFLELLEDSDPPVNAYKLRYFHFYRDPEHIKIADGWYQWKPGLFRNRNGNFIGGSGIMSNVELDKFGQALNKTAVSMPEDIVSVFHYGHMKSTTSAWGRKINQLEATYGEDGKGQHDPSLYEWDMRGTERFEGQHPDEMRERIRRFLKKDD